MDKGEGDKSPDDGIVAEDLTLLVEHIELTSPHRLPETHEWEMASPAADLDDAPILVGEVPDDDPELESMRVDEEDTQLYTETQADLNQLLVTERRRNDQAAALATERARWQQRVDDLQRALAERDQLLVERERRIEVLQAKLATRTLEREGLAAELRESRPLNAAVTDALPPEALADGADANAEQSPEVDLTLELPVPELPPVAPAVAAIPRLRRYLIGLDLVGCVHEITEPASQHRPHPRQRPAHRRPDREPPARDADGAERRGHAGRREQPERHLRERHPGALRAPRRRRPRDLRHGPFPLSRRLGIHGRRGRLRLKARFFRSA